MEQATQLPGRSKLDALITAVLKRFGGDTSLYNRTISWNELPALFPELAATPLPLLRTVIRFCGSAKLLYQYQENEAGFRFDGLSESGAVRSGNRKDRFLLWVYWPTILVLAMWMTRFFLYDLNLGAFLGL